MKKSMTTKFKLKRANLVFSLWMRGRQSQSKRPPRRCFKANPFWSERARGWGLTPACRIFGGKMDFGGNTRIWGKGISISKKWQIRLGFRRILILHGDFTDTVLTFTDPANLTGASHFCKNGFVRLSWNPSSSPPTSTDTFKSPDSQKTSFTNATVPFFIFNATQDTDAEENDAIYQSST